MSFDFLPDNLPPPPPPPKPSRGSDKHVKISNVYFYDTYRNYIDFRNIASIPPVSSEFKHLKNFEIYEDKFTSEYIKNKCRDDSWYGPNTTYEGLISGYNLFTSSCNNIGKYCIAISVYFIQFKTVVMNLSLLNRLVVGEISGRH